LDNKTDSPQILADVISKEMVAGATYVNVVQECIVITEDRTYRCLKTWRNQIEARDRWIAPVCLFAGLALAFVTCTFNDTFGIPKDTWHAFFMFVIGASALWTLLEVSKKLRYRGKGSEEDLIKELKKGATIVQSGGSATQAINTSSQ